jgi:hypothetical protein
MRFKSFKCFPLGKPKKKPGGDPPARQIALTEEKMNGDAHNLGEMAQKIEGLATGSNGEEGPKPHGPLSELSLEPDDSSRDELSNAIPEPEGESQEQVKLLEVNPGKGTATTPAPAPAPAPAPSPATPAGAAPSTEGLNNLFRDEEEEENPLANLIRTLPDYTTHEIVEDLNEIKRIIKEWQRE